MLRRAGAHTKSGQLRRRLLRLMAGLALVIYAVYLSPLDLTGTVEPLAALDNNTTNVVGIVPALGGVALTLYAQVAMGESWRIGVDHDERTELVTDGPFALVRNPIFSAMIPTALGLALMVPSAISIAAVTAVVIALELQVRVVEGPYLLQAQGRTYRDYAAKTGRFFFWAFGPAQLSDGIQGIAVWRVRSRSECHRDRIRMYRWRGSARVRETLR